MPNEETEKPEAKKKPEPRRRPDSKDKKPPPATPKVTMYQDRKR